MAKKVKVQAAPHVSWLFKSIVFLGMLLMTIGIFGTILINKSFDVTGLSYEYTNIGFKTFFDIIKQISEAGGASTTSASTAESSSYVCIILFFFAILVTLIPTLVMFLKQKKEINVKKTFAFASVGSLIYFFANLLSWNVIAKGTVLGKTETFGTSLGWGSALIITGFAVGVVGLILIELFNTKSFISLRNIFAKAGLVLMFFIAIFGSIAVSLSYSNDYGSTAQHLSLFRAIGILSIEGKDTGASIGGTAIVFSLASLVFFALTLYKFIFNNPNKKGNSIIVFSSIYFVTALISNVCIKNFAEAIKSDPASQTPSFVNISLGSGAIVQLVLGLLVVVAAILTRVFRKTDREVA